MTWFRDTPTTRRLLAAERQRLAKAEALYQCERCGRHLEPDYTLGSRANRIRAKSWKIAHKLNCTSD